MPIQRELANELTAWIQGIGIALPGGSRFHTMAKVLSRLSVGPRLADRDDPHTKIQVQAVHDLLELDFVRQSRIFEESSEANRGGLDHVLRLALKDPAIPGETQSRGRDRQKELFAAAAFHYAGLRPVVMAEPDVVCTWNEKLLGVAVKNAASPENFDKLIRLACEQIAASGHDGIVWCDMSKLLSSSTTLHATDHEGRTAGEAQRKEVRAFVWEHISALRDGGANGRVLLFVFIASRTTIDREGTLRLESLRLYVDVPQWTKRVESESASLKLAMKSMFASLSPEQWPPEGPG